MSLAADLQIKKGEITALVGGGGKTTALYALGRELACRGERVLLTTTTRLFPPDSVQGVEVRFLGEFLREPEASPGIAIVGTKVGPPPSSRPLLLVRGERQGKLVGLAPQEVPVLGQGFDYVLVEADGSAGLPLKAPAKHEPALPQGVGRVLLLAGLTALGQPLARCTHRPELAAAASGAVPDTLINPVLLARLVLLLARQVNSLAPAVPVTAVLNQAEGREEEAGEVVDQLWAGGLSALFMASLQHGWVRPLKPRFPRLAALVAAAGEAQRLGGEKLLLPWRGKPLLAHTVDNLLLSPVGQVVVVLGHRQEEIQAMLGDRLVETVTNPAYREGLAASLRAGLAEISPQADGVLVALGDLPRVFPAVPAALRQVWREHPEAWAVVPTWHGQRGHPVLFARKLWSELTAQKGDRGGKDILAQHTEHVLEVPVTCPWIATDIDTPGEYHNLLRE